MRHFRGLEPLQGPAPPPTGASPTGRWCGARTGRRRRCWWRARRDGGPVPHDRDGSGATLMRWNRSRCMPSASARIDLMMSPWLTATHTAPGPCSASNAASCRRIAATDRACMAAMDSPPGNLAADGCVCTTDQMLLGEFAEGAALPVAVVALGDALLDQRPGAPAGGRGSSRAVCRQRSKGLETTATSGTAASRSAVRGGLVAPDLVQPDSGRASGQHAVHVRGGATVPHEDDCGHAYSLETQPAAPPGPPVPRRS